MKRRKFITITGTAVAGAALTTAVAAPGQRSIISSIFSNDEISPAKYRPDPSKWSEHDFTIAWLGHSTLLINFFGTRIITDPVFSKKIGFNILGLFTLGPQRLVDPALDFHEVGKVDVILLSHAHMDHLDYASLKEFNSDAKVIMAKNTKDIIGDLDYHSVRELDWGEKRDVADLTLEALEVNHFGWRFPWEDDRARGDADGRSFNAYLLKKNGFSFLFGGDTAYTSVFKKLGGRGEKIDLAAMPIGAYDPWIKVHCNPEQALEMTRDMNAEAILPIHWQTFTLSNEATMEPIVRLKNAAENSSVEIIIDTIGQTVKME